VGYAYFESWIESLAYVRNICAHYGRLYNTKLSKAPQLYKQYNESGISNFSIFSILLTLKNLLPNDSHWHDFVQTIELLFEKYPNVKLQLIGFPPDWTKYLQQ
jgi:abortive infection bacteriophage resistance protein